MRRWVLWLGLVVLAALVAAFAYGCGETSFGSCADNGTCAPDGGADTGADVTIDSPSTLRPDAPSGDAEEQGDGGVGPTDGSAMCDTTKEPREATCLVTEPYGVFVAAGAAPGGVGTRASPVSSINAGIALASMQPVGGQPKHVYVCAGTYDESIVVDATRDAVSLFGGFECSDWAYTGPLPKLAPSTAAVPLTLTNLTSALFADIEIDALSGPATPPATPSASGISSISVVASGSTGVEFRRAKIVAGNGQPGANGTLTPYGYPDAGTLNGNPGNGGTGGPAKSFVCPGGAVTIGGKGGNAPTGSGDPGLPALDGGAGETSDLCFENMAGPSVGANAGAATNGPGAASVGAFSASRWVPNVGSPGAAGGPGQGGGGGGALNGGGGGSGGAGGCGGAGGGAGGGGGASLAIASVDSEVVLHSVTLLCGAAGNGAAGVSGQPGQSQSGFGGVQGSSGACPGGRGGNGGAGGAGGGGAGGPSAGVLYEGPAPTLDLMTTANFVPGQAGAKGTGGVPGVNDGVPGTAGITVSVP
jgi:hypothetical protein